MSRVDADKKMLHLFAGLIALGLAGAVLFGGASVVVHFERATISSTAPDIFSLKNQGLAFQRAAAHSGNVLPIYGSSELLVPPVPEKGNNFFRTAPSGFQVSPVGGGGANTLVMLQKVGALGSDLRGKKVAISLSPGWFLAPKPTWNGYKGNFSPMAANELIFGTALGFELKRDIALRMLQCPSTLENRPLLEFVLKLLSSGRWLDRTLFCVLWPVGKVEVSLLELEDHLAAFNYIRHGIKPASPAVPEILDWPKLIARVETTKSTDPPNASKSSGLNAQITPGARDVGFRNGVDVSPSWIDLELLLRTLASIHAQPLLLSMPIAGQFYDHAGVSRSAREDYYGKLRAMVQRYHFALVEFEEHDEDPAFLLRHQSHLTVKGWMYYDRALDDFFHGRAPRS